MPTIMAACADLLFTARIRAAAQAVGLHAVSLTARDDAVALIRAQPPALLLLDLDARWLDAPSLLRALGEHPGTASIPVVAFVSHVRTDAIAAARAAGASRVLARSAFVQQLPGLLRTAAGTPPD